MVPCYINDKINYNLKGLFGAEDRDKCYIQTVPEEYEKDGVKWTVISGLLMLKLANSVLATSL